MKSHTQTPTTISSLPTPFPTARVTELAFDQIIGPSMGKLMQALGTNIHYGARSGAQVQDSFSGKWYWDCHRNGSLYNLGHRHPVIVNAVSGALSQLEVGNLFLSSGYKALAAQKLVASTDHGLTGAVFAASGTEANDCAIRVARGFTQRRKLVSVNGCYHGMSAFTMAAGDDPASCERYMIDFPEFVKVPFNDIDAMRAAVDDETACVLLEASPAQLGFPEPAPGYFAAIRQICDDKGALFILDEVQTGLGSSGSFWLWQEQGIMPDMLTSAKGLGGGIIANAALLMAPAVKDWFIAADFPNVSTFGGSELGCVATSAVCDLTSSADFTNNVRRLIEQFREGFANAQFKVNQVGLCMGLLSDSMDSFTMTRKLADAGVLTLPAHYQPNAIEFRPVLILDEHEAETIISKVRNTIG